MNEKQTGMNEKLTRAALNSSIASPDSSCDLTAFNAYV